MGFRHSIFVKLHEVQDLTDNFCKKVKNIVGLAKSFKCELGCKISYNDIVFFLRHHN